MALHIARGFELPDDFVTQTAAILARRGAGKTYTAKVIAEELLEQQLPIVVLDPVGVWHGLRSDARGTGPGYAVTILGGEHGDLPLDEHAGTLVANLVATDPVAVVLDLSGFESKGAQRRFVTDFAERLYRAKAGQSARTALHLIIDEADEFAPQSSSAGDRRMLGAFETLVRRGRARGIGVTMITQRPAVLNKNVLTQTECLIVMQLTSPQDRKAIGAWVEGNASSDELRTVDASLASMEQGDAWFWSPAWLRTLQRVHIRKARTFDSSATPKAGETRREAKVLAPVDLDRLKEGMDRVVADAEANDPRKLRARIAQLEADVARLEAQPAREVEVERVVEVVPDWVETELRAALGTITNARAVIRTREEITEALIERLENVGAVGSDDQAERAPAPPTGAVAPTVASTTQRHANGPRASKVPSAPTNPADLNTQATKMLGVLVARHPATITVAQLSTLSGYSRRSSSWGPAMKQLRDAGLAAVVGKDVVATDAGVATLGGNVPAVKSGPEVLAMWAERLDVQPRAFLHALVDHGPLTKSALADLTDYSLTSSSFGASLSALRKNSLIVVDGDTISVDADFLTAIRRV